MSAHSASLLYVQLQGDSWSFSACNRSAECAAVHQVAEYTSSSEATVISCTEEKHHKSGLTDRRYRTYALPLNIWRVLTTGTRFIVVVVRCCCCCCHPFERACMTFNAYSMEKKSNHWLPQQYIETTRNFSNAFSWIFCTLFTSPLPSAEWKTRHFHLS